MSPALRGVLFDVDDTLVRTAETGFAKCAEVAARLGLAPPSEAAFRDPYGRVPFRECVALWHPGVDVDAYQAAYDGLADAFPPVPIGSFADVVAACRAAGLRVGVLTNGPDAKTERKLPATGVDPASLDGVWHAGNVPWPKPDPRCFAGPLREWGAEPGELLYVGDAATDAAAAAAAGVRFARADPELRAWMAELGTPVP